MESAITLNTEEQCYVETYANSSVSTGFLPVFAETGELVKRLSRRKDAPTSVSLAAPTLADFGTEALYRRHTELTTLYANLNDKTTWYDDRTPEEVRLVLENSRFLKRKVRLFSCDDWGYDSLMDWDVGVISTGPNGLSHPRLLETATGRSHVVMAHWISRIIDAKTGAVLYSIPNYKLPLLSVEEGARNPFTDRATFEVRGRIPGRESFLAGIFASQSEAQKFKSFLSGESLYLNEDDALI